MTAASLAAFPELWKLISLRERGWKFFPLTRCGELTQINGLRAWPGGCTDAIRVRYTTDAAGIRCDCVGGVVWRFDGTLADVVDGLLALPAPDTHRSRP